MKTTKIFTLSLIFILISIALFTTPAGVRADIAPTLNEGIVLYLPFDEGSGTVAIDASGNNYHGTITGATYTVGKYDTGLYYDSTDKTVVSDHALLDSSSLTLSVWFNNSIADNTLNRNRLVNKKTAWNSADGYSIQLTTGGKILVLGSSSTEVSATVLSGTWDTNAWHLITVTITGTTASIYFDGESVTSGVITGILDSTGSLEIGGSSVLGTYCGGEIDDFRVYNRVLSDTEILSLFVNPQPTPTPTPTSTIDNDDMKTSTMVAVGLLAFLVVLNLVLLGLGSMIIRFIVALFTLVIAGASIVISGFPFAPYLQMFGVVMSLICMFMAAKAKG